jgi:hypothetical protein
VITQSNNGPTSRKLRAFAFDPSLATELENFDVSEVTITLPWEPLEPGPVGEYVEVVDIDPASNCGYEPVDLGAEKPLAENGLAPSEGDPHFHQQMVYAVSMTTIKHFERAWGRRILWSDQEVSFAPDKKKPKALDRKWLPTERLRIYPHALRENNAYYDSEKKALLFGYFPAQPLGEGDAMTGGIVFTCLSHDIIAHETTHAILDGANRYLMEPSNVDVLAFHEAFADIVALFQHFTYPEILRRQIARARGDLTTETLLGQLAVQFGRATGERGALRDAIGSWESGKWQRRIPNPDTLRKTTEPHDRGAMLVATIFDAYLAIYQQRTRDLLRIATGGTGVLPAGDLHPDLVERLAREAAKTARHMLTMCIRAIDYCPPVDLSFGDYLRALITADYDVFPDDSRNYRVALIEAFRKWGIYPEDVRTLSVESLRWEQPDLEELKPFLYGLHRALNDQRRFVSKSGYRNYPHAWEEIRSGVNMSGEAGFDQRRKLNLREIWERTEALSERIHGQIHNKALYVTQRGSGAGTIFGLNLQLGHINDWKYQVETLRPVLRADSDGRTRSDLVVQLIQRRPGFFDPKRQEIENRRYDTKGYQKQPPPFGECDFKFRGGASFIIDLETYQVRYAVSKSILNTRRMERQRKFQTEGAFTTDRELYFGKASAGQQLANLHAGIY